MIRYAQIFSSNWVRTQFTPPMLVMTGSEMLFSEPRFHAPILCYSRQLDKRAHTEDENQMGNALWNLMFFLCLFVCVCVCVFVCCALWMRGAVLNQKMNNIIIDDEKYDNNHNDTDDNGNDYSTITMTIMIMMILMISVMVLMMLMLILMLGMMMMMMTTTTKMTTTMPKVLLIVS